MRNTQPLLPKWQPHLLAGAPCHADEAMPTEDGRDNPNTNVEEMPYFEKQVWRLEGGSPTTRLVGTDGR